MQISIEITLLAAVLIGGCAGPADHDTFKAKGSYPLVRLSPDQRTRIRSARIRRWLPQPERTVLITDPVTLRRLLELSCSDYPEAWPDDIPLRMSTFDCRVELLDADAAVVAGFALSTTENWGKGVHCVRVPADLVLMATDALVIPKTATASEDQRPTRG
jgi:hypothetical protein